MTPQRDFGSPAYVVLGWGSLIWSPRNLQRLGDWCDGGPQLPIEFTRISSDGRLTLVVDEIHGAECSTWSCRTPLRLPAAVDDLAAREGCKPRHIGAVKADHEASSGVASDVEQRIANWCRESGYSGAVWTALPPTFEERAGVPFSVQAAIGYLESLEGPKRERAFEYIRRAPSSTDTPLRRAFHARWGGSA